MYKLITALQDTLLISFSYLTAIPIETCLNITLWIAQGYTAIIVGRFVIVLLMCQLGLYNPNQYCYWPRLPWRFFYRCLRGLMDWREHSFLVGKRGNTGGFASALETFCELFTPKRILLGGAFVFGLKFLQPVGGKIERHGYMIAMTGAGKTTMIISVLSQNLGAALVVDPKGSITKALAGKDKRNFSTIDPYGMTGLISAHINPFDIIKWGVARSGEDDAVRWAFRIAETLISTPPESKSPFFTDTYRSFFVGLILHVLTAHPEEHHNLPFVRDLSKFGYQKIDEKDGQAVSPEDAQELLLGAMRGNTALSGIISGGAAALENAGAETAGNVRATGLEQTAWLDIPQVRNVMLESTFDISKLKTDNKDILSLVAPVTAIRGELAPFFRLITNLTTFVFEAETKKKGQCLMIVDEHPSLGYNPVFELALAVYRDYGITFIGISQDLELLQKVYQKSWEGFIGNADIVWWMGTNHERTAQYLSKILGKVSRVETDRQTGRKSYRDVEVATTDQIKRFLAPESGRIIVTRAGKRALRLVNEPYYKALSVLRYHADPAHKETILRRLTRRLFFS